MKQFIIACFFLAGISIPAPAQNTAPVVNAGSDTSARVGVAFRFNASVQDDGLPGPDLLIEWTQLSGPMSGAEIMIPSAPRTLVNFLTMGNYEFMLIANDGALMAADTVKIAVADSIPFRVITPAAGAKIEIGSLHH